MYKWTTLNQELNLNLAEQVTCGKLTNNKDEKLIYTIYISGQNRECLFLTEDGLYETLMQSRQPIAKVFKKEKN